MKIGFIVNPYAGMGGSVGLKGTDGCAEEARALGAIPQSPERSLQFLKALKKPSYHYFLVAGGDMGEEELNNVNNLENQVFSYETVYKTASQYSSMDTKAACKAMLNSGVDLIIFCGGDGTAVDVFSVIGNTIPILGIPAGVKVFSAVFATTPISAAKILDNSESLKCTDAEVLDIDEEKYRAGILTTKIYGIAKIPSVPTLVQAGKSVSFGDERHDLEDIALFITNLMNDNTLYLIGAGSTTKAITDRLNVDSTLLGIDAVYNGKIVATDLNEKAILTLLEKYSPVKIILSPIGAQGFVLGRGNQQISRTVLKKAGIDSLIVVATPTKLQNTPRLFIDTGDPVLNEEFDDTILVICGYAMGMRIPVVI